MILVTSQFIYISKAHLYIGRVIKKMLKEIIGLVIGSYVVAATIPGAVSAVQAANTSGFSTAELALWPLMGLIIVAGSLYSIAHEAGLL